MSRFTITTYHRRRFNPRVDEAATAVTSSACTMLVTSSMTP
jgi:hypothetical protein